jgi:hypothetical protein
MICLTACPITNIESVKITTEWFGATYTEILPEVYMKK